MESELDVWLKKLESDLQKLKEAIEEVHTDMIKEEFTKYPIFIAHQGDIDIGELVFDSEEYETSYSINVATAENLLELGILNKEKMPAFKEAYKDTSIQTCILWIHGAGIRFIFFPLKAGLN